MTQVFSPKFIAMVFVSFLVALPALAEAPATPATADGPEAPTLAEKLQNRVEAAKTALKNGNSVKARLILDSVARRAAWNLDRRTAEGSLSSELQEALSSLQATATRLKERAIAASTPKQRREAQKIERARDLRNQARLAYRDGNVEQAQRLVDAAKAQLAEVDTSVDPFLEKVHLRISETLARITERIHQFAEEDGGATADAYSAYVTNVIQQAEEVARPTDIDAVRMPSSVGSGAVNSASGKPATGTQ